MCSSVIIWLFLALGVATLSCCVWWVTGVFFRETELKEDAFKEFDVSNAATGREDFFVAFPSLRGYRHRPEYDNLEFRLWDLAKVRPVSRFRGISPRDAKWLVEREGFRNATPEELVYYAKKQVLLGEKGESLGSYVVALGEFAKRTTEYHSTGILIFNSYPGGFFLRNWGCDMDFILDGGFSTDNTFFLGVRKKKS